MLALRRRWRRAEGVKAMTDESFLVECEKRAQGGFDTHALSRDVDGNPWPVSVRPPDERMLRLIAMIRERDARIAKLTTAARSGLNCGCQWCETCIDSLSDALDRIKELEAERRK